MKIQKPHKAKGSWNFRKYMEEYFRKKKNSGALAFKNGNGSMMTNIQQPLDMER